jgi:hypothetical protein
MTIDISTKIGVVLFRFFLKKVKKLGGNFLCLGLLRALY